MEKHINKLSKIIQDGPVLDIFRAEQALSFLNTTESFSKRINKTILENSLGRFKISVQNN